MREQHNSTPALAARLAGARVFEPRAARSPPAAASLVKVPPVSSAALLGRLAPEFALVDIPFTVSAFPPSIGGKDSELL